MSGGCVEKRFEGMLEKRFESRDATGLREPIWLYCKLDYGSRAGEEQEVG